MTLFSILAKGGWLMTLIFLCLFILIVLVVERLIVLRRAKINTGALMIKLRGTLSRAEVTEAMSLCESTPGPVASVVSAGLKKHRGSREVVQEAMDGAGRAEMRKLERNLGAIATIAGVAPLLGFLGTVTGMIRAFMKIQVLGGNVNASVLAGGIWEALVTTASGLAVGIPAFILYNYFVGRVESFGGEMEKASNELMDLLRSGGGE